MAKNPGPLPYDTCLRGRQAAQAPFEPGGEPENLDHASASEGVSGILREFTGSLAAARKDGETQQSTTRARQSSGGGFGG